MQEKSRHYIGLALLMVFAACERQTPVTVAEPTLVEGLVLRAAAELAEHGVHVSLRRLRAAGLGVRIERVTVTTNQGSVRFGEVRVGLGAAASGWPLVFLPAISMTADTMAFVRPKARTGSAPPPTPKKAAPQPDPAKVAAVLQELVATQGGQKTNTAAFGSAPGGSGAAPDGKPALGLRSAALPPLIFDLRVRRLFLTKRDRLAVHARVVLEPGNRRGEIELAGDGVALRGVGVESSGRMRGRLEAFGVPLATLTKLVVDEHSLSVTAGRGAATIELEQEDELIFARAAFAATDLCMAQGKLGEGRACGIAAAGSARLGASGGAVFLDAAQARFNGVELSAHGRFPLRASGEFDAEIAIPAQPVQRVLAAIPRAWRTGLLGFQLTGQFSAALRLGGSGESFAAAPEFLFKNARVERAPIGQDPRQLNFPVAWQLSFPYARSVFLGPSSPAFVAVHEVPAVVIDAIRVSEDASFFGHDGFDRGEIAKALTELREGAAFRGASTLTQQLAKNLFFDGDRNLTRKIEEACVTAALEASVSKWRLLEIYLNIVEWGDGVYGLTAASKHYFGKRPSELGPAEAVFLAGILPAPRRVDRELRRDGASPWADRRVQRVTRMLCSLGRLPVAACGDSAVVTVLAD